MSELDGKKMELLPCAHCGELPDITENKDSHYPHRVTHQCPRLTYAATTRQEAINEWNRAQLEAEKPVRCGECEYEKQGCTKATERFACGGVITQKLTFCSYGKRKEG